MTFASRIFRTTCALAIGMLVASSAGAQSTQTRRRAVSPPAGPTTSITGTVKDAANGLPVHQATVTYLDQSSPTNANGQFVLNVPTGTPVTITIQHPAFELSTQSLTQQIGGKYDFRLTEKPSVTIRTKSDETHVVDIGTAQFGVASAFSNAALSDNANFCKSDGTAFTPSKFEFSRIVGPATPATVAACCQSATLLGLKVELKSGATLPVYFKDSCDGLDVIFVGREKTTGLYPQFKFTDIVEIDFQ